MHRGGSVGGKCYGYLSHPVYSQSSDRHVVGIQQSIIESEAEVIRRICDDYANGLSFGAISRRLNADGVPAPRGAHWNATSIRRIIQSSRYRGTVVWNRTQHVINPDTGQVESRPRREEEVVSAAMPHLRIVGDDLAARVDARLKQTKR